MLVCKCKNCGKEAIVDESIILATFPPKYGYDCLHCKDHGYTDCKDAYPAHKSEPAKPKIEKLGPVPCDDGMCIRQPNTAEIIKKINEIIDYLNNRGE